MKPLVLTLKERPAERLDLSPVLPHLIAGKSAGEIARIEVQTTRRPLTVGDVFRLRMGDAGREWAAQHSWERSTTEFVAQLTKLTPSHRPAPVADAGLDAQHLARLITEAVAHRTPQLAHDPQA